LARETGAEVGPDKGPKEVPTIDKDRRLVLGMLYDMMTKTLKPNPARRYRSTDELIEDLRRYGL
jgi:hypothetical protein